MSFQIWMQQVNELCLCEFLMSIYDLPDMDFWDAYDSGQSPEQFLAEAIPDLDALSAIVLS